MLYAALLVLSFFFLFITSTVQWVTTNGMSFSSGGQPYSFAGSNQWILGCNSDQYVDDVMRASRNAGFQVIRVAAFIQADHANGLQGTFGSQGESYFQSWNDGRPTVNEGDNGLQLMDYAVQQAENNDIQFIMILANEWRDYGGMDTWVQNIKGQSGLSRTLFYTDSDVQDAWRDYVSFIVNRYKHSSAIFAWELANEPRCQDPDCAGGVLTQWADRSSSFIKSIDPNHMITWGGYGFIDDGYTDQHGWDFQYDGGSGEDSAALLALPNIDFGTVHLYTNDDGSQGPSYGMQWLKDHNNMAANANKPMIMEELGVNRDNSDISMPDVLNSYQQYILSSSAFQGSMLWSGLNVDSDCPVAGDPYAICPADDCWNEIVADFTSQMNGKGGYSRIMRERKRG